MDETMRKTTKDCPGELAVSIEWLWPEAEWSNAASIAFLESNFDAFAVNDTVTPDHPCGSVIATRGGVRITAEVSVGYFQINACNIDMPQWTRLYNAEQNAMFAYDLWSRRGWSPWYFSAKKLGLI
jgi:hypothetical protein